MSRLVDFAKNELERIEKSCGKDKEALEIQKLMREGIMRIIYTFSEEGHSGFSASYAISIINRLLRYQPLSPLTGEDDEWVELNYNDNMAYQNKRFSEIFKRKDGTAYWSEGKVFSEDGGHTWYTGNDSKVNIAFPYTVPNEPERVIIDNQKERKIIFDKICNIFKDMDIIIPTDINEDSELNFINNDQIDSLNKLMKVKFEYKNALYNLTSEDKMWNAVNVALLSE